MVLYLAICKLHQPAPPEAFPAYIAQCEYCGDLEQRGKVRLFAPTADFSGGIAILEVASHEEAQQVVAQGPLFPFVSAELIPLVDADAAKQLVRQMISAMAQA